MVRKEFPDILRHKMKASTHHLSLVSKSGEIIANFRMQLIEGLTTLCSSLARRIVRLPADTLEGISKVRSFAAAGRNPPTNVEGPVGHELVEVLQRTADEQGSALVEPLQNNEILIRFPDGSRKEQNFSITDTIRSIYKYIDAQDIPGIGSYQLISFPKRVFAHEHLDMTLRDAGLHPNAALFLVPNQL
ncbi:UBX domain-containing protein 7-like isoform X2 [Asparagus officinalis]|uniref:UBX domain-containing protein 7-like isoform X2 n=1 Tax=Asparagus officinalis TaxID=4686 RepID=UPI00098E11A1|nr:UBX domain-containing protein 7-like isoform X2 [Asparagus officinalis]